MKIRLIFLTITMLLAAVILCSCANDPTFYTLKYTAGEGGIIDGEAEQTVERRRNGNAVTAVPNDGYEFVKWSDGVETAARQDKNVKKDLTVTAEFRKTDGQVYTITYLVEEGGTLTGETIQRITEEIYGTDVIVHVQDGYEFIGWSDGKKEQQRRDYHDHQDKTFTAKIRRKDYNLQNWYTEFGVGVPTVTINKDTVDNLSFPVPTREHFTFNGWYLGDTLVGDEQGNSLFTRDMLEDGNRDIVAKWTANETFTYKILLVYVTRINATLPTVDNTTTIHVDYTMSELEREFYHLTTVRLKEYLDNIMDGLVDFQVDEYYTTQTVVTQDFKQGSSSVGKVLTNLLSVDYIPEAKEIIKNYDSALSVYSLNDGKRNLVDFNGSAHARYGEIYADTFLYDANFKELICELKKPNFDFGNDTRLNFMWFDTFIHELAHTMECRINAYSYHACIYDGMKTLTDRYKQKMYYLNEIDKDGKRVGIPYEFWAGNILKVCYATTEGGRYATWQGFPIGNEYIFEVPYGYNALPVMAQPSLGYEFVEWSDGVKTATRKDTNITEDKTITAIFRPIVYKLTVIASEGGWIREGEGTWEIQANGEYISLKVEAEEGYKFVGWSDGNVAIRRPFKIENRTVNLFDENNEYTLVAIFEKIE